MIRRNDRLNPNDDNPNDPQAMRDFTKILRAANNLWQKVFSKPDQHTARGLVFTANRGITADLSFNKYRKRVILMIRLRANNNLTPLQEQFINKVQNESQGLSFVAFDKKTRMLKIRSQSVLPTAIMARAIVPEVIKDAVAILENENLKDIVEHSVSY